MTAAVSHRVLGEALTGHLESRQRPPLVDVPGVGLAASLQTRSAP